MTRLKTPRVGFLGFGHVEADIAHRRDFFFADHTLCLELATHFVCHRLALCMGGRDDERRLSFADGFDIVFNESLLGFFTVYLLDEFHVIQFCES